MGSVNRVSERAADGRAAPTVASVPATRVADWARAVVAYAVAILVPWAAFRGTGGLVMHAPVQARSLALVAAVVALSFVVLTLPQGRRPAIVVATSIAAPLLAAILLRNLAGRLAGITAVVFAIAVHATVVGWRADAEGRRVRTVWTAVPPLVVAAVVWLSADRPDVVIASCAVALVVHAAHLVSPLPDRADAAARRHGRRLVLVSRAALAASGSAIGAVAAVVVGGARRLITRSALLGRRLGARRAMLGGAVALGVSPLLWRMWGGPGAYYLSVNDYTVHGETFRELRWWPFEVQAPHFLFHLVGRVVAVITGERAGAVVTLAAAVFLTYLAWTVVFAEPAVDGRRTLSPARAAWLAVLPVVIESPTVLALWAGWTPPNTRFMTVQLLYSPTWIASLPLSIAAIWMAVRLGERLRNVAGHLTWDDAWRATWPLATVVALGVLTKPALALCLLPALPVHLLTSARLGVRRVLPVTLIVVVPSAALMAWQTWFMARSQLWANGFTFDPIAGPVYGWRHCGWWFWVPFVWILVAAAMTRGAWFREPAVRLSLWCFAFGVPIFTLFRETGERAQDGNLGLPVQVSAVLLIGLSIRSCGREVVGWIDARRDAAGGASRGAGAASRGAGAWCGVVVCLAVLFVAAGIVAQLDGLGMLEVPISWYPLY